MGLCPNYPVESVSWNNVQDYIAKLNSTTSKGRYRLPTEAEWEFAARGGTETAYSFGDDSSKLGEYACYSKNSGNQKNSGNHQTCPVGVIGLRKANPYGLYDMHGNVWEWVQDRYSKKLPGKTDPLQTAGFNRIVRGGGWSRLCAVLAFRVS